MELSSFFLPRILILELLELEKDSTRCMMKVQSIKSWIFSTESSHAWTEIYMTYAIHGS